MRRLTWLMVVVGCTVSAAAWAHPHRRLPGDEFPTVQVRPSAAAGFSWVSPGHLAALSFPGGRRPLAEDLAFLQAEGIDLLVTLTVAEIPSELLAAYGIEALHLPVVDHTAPTLAQIDTFLAAAGAARRDGRRVAVHCRAGLGRTGTMLAAYFVSQGLPAEEAVAKVRRLRPGSIETPAQTARIHEFADRP